MLLAGDQCSTSISRCLQCTRRYCQKLQLTYRIEIAAHKSCIPLLHCYMHIGWLCDWLGYDNDYRSHTWQSVPHKCSALAQGIKSDKHTFSNIEIYEFLAVSAKIFFKCLDIMFAQQCRKLPTTYSKLSHHSHLKTLLFKIQQFSSCHTHPTEIEIRE